MAILSERGTYQWGVNVEGANAQTLGCELSKMSSSK